MVARMGEEKKPRWEQRFRETAELLPGVICEINADFRITYANRLAFESFGYDEQALERGVYVVDLIHPDDLERGKVNFIGVLEGRPAGPQEYRMVYRDGRVVEYQVNSSPMYDGDRIVGVRTCLFDITDRKRAERALRASEERFRQAFSQSPSGVVIYDRNGRPVDANPAFRQMFHLGADAPAHEIPALYDLLGDDESLEQGLAAGKTERRDATFAPPGGGDRSQLRYFEWTVTPIRAEEPAQVMLLAQVQDVTERRLAEEAKLREAQEAAESARRLVENLRKEVRQTFTFRNMVSRSPQMRKIFDLLPEVAETTATVLVTGESGTGKELIARAIHELGSRKDKPFVAINCSALPDNLLESELFGYKAGAFTDAKKDKPGKFAIAEGGAIFLDEAGDISPAMQVKLLRVLQERTYEPLGGTASVKADVRVIAATNRDLPAMVKAGGFREDLYYRLNILEIKLPPLRERRTDIPLLVDHFIGIFNQRYDRSVAGISREALDALLTHDFPGNVRELENIVERAFIFCKEGEIQLSQLPDQLAAADCADAARALTCFGSFEELEAHYLRAVLEETGGNKLEAARKLGIHKSTLFRKLKKLGIADA
jgi:PAS domain S-box-containing protein